MVLSFIHVTNSQLSFIPKGLIWFTNLTTVSLFSLSRVQNMEFKFIHVTNSQLSLILKGLIWFTNLTTGSPDVLLVKSWPLGSCYLRIILRV